MSRKSKLWSAKPELKMIWCVPVTHSVPLGLRVPRPEVTEFFTRGYLWKPIERIESLRLPLRFRVLLGGDKHELEVPG